MKNTKIIQLENFQFAVQILGAFREVVETVYFDTLEEAEEHSIFAQTHKPYIKA